jgi:hypothetical protein
MARSSKTDDSRAREALPEAPGFEQHGQSLVATFRVSFDPDEDKDLIKQLSQIYQRGGNRADLVRVALRAVLSGPADNPSNTEPGGLQVEILRDQSGVVISGPQAGGDGIARVVVYRTHLPALVAWLFKELPLLNRRGNVESKVSSRGRAGNARRGNTG